MGVVAVREIWGGRTGDLDQEGNRTYSRVFRVQTNSSLDGPLTARDADGVPRIGSPYADASGLADTGARCRTVNANQDGDNPLLWIVTAEFTSKSDSPENQQQNPILRRTKLNFRAAKRRVAKETDIDGNAVVNAAGDAFDPPIETDEAHLVMEVEKNRLVFDPAEIVYFVHAVNDASWFGMPARTWLLEDMHADEQEEGDVIYYKVKYVFELNPDTWDTSILNVGYNELVGGERRAIRDQGEQKEPQLLDVDGVRLAPGGNPTYEVFKFQRRRNFSLLGIP